MSIDLRVFFKATDPSRTLFINNTLDSKFYIDFSSVRGGDIIQTLKKRITFFQPDEPTCTLFTGHIGCGKSTELIRLQAELESLGFHVVYFESTDDLEITDVGIADVLLAIARRISQSLDKINLEDTNKFNTLLQGALQLLNAEVTGLKAKVPGVGDVGFSAEKEKLSLSVGIGEITTKIKSDPRLREKINQYLAPQKIQLLEAINQELLQPAITKLKQQGKNGLVVIVDNLDRIDNSPKPWGRPQQEYLFVDQGEYLTKLSCHLIYTMPLSLKFSNDYGTLTQRFDDPKVLPMVSVQYPDGSIHQQGMALMQQMVLARAFPDLEPAARLEKITEIFDSVSSLERLCIASGGHVRDLLRLLNTWIMEEMSLPLTRNVLEQVIRSRRNEIKLPISESEWQLLRDVKRTKQVNDDDGYQKLIRSRFVFEYRESGESWFDVNPILAEARELAG
jgi:hypothetical protein